MTTFEQWISGWNATADAHRSALAKGWAVAHQFADLHGACAPAISRSLSADPPPARERALILLALHGLNVYGTALSTTMRGQPDVSSYLLRALLDVGALTHACGHHEDLAERFIEGRLKPARARRQLIADLRSLGENELADEFDERLRGEGDAANTLAHTSAHHLRSLRASGDYAGSVPAAGGFLDIPQAKLMLGAILQVEHYFLRWFFAAVPDRLGEPWERQLDDAYIAMSEWFDEDGIARRTPSV